MFKYTKVDSGYFALHIQRGDSSACTCFTDSSACPEKKDAADQLATLLGADVSVNSSDEVEAMEKGNELLLANPTAKVFALHLQRRVIEFKKAPTISDGEVGEAFKMAVRPLDPTSANADGGFTTITPHKQGPITLVPMLIP